MINNDYKTEIINYIEHNLYNSFNINTLSENKYISTMQLYRDFYNITGHSVKEYIRKRRLSNALSLIKHSDMSIADISYSCGYSSQQAFHKVVKATIGITPLQYKVSENYFYFPKYNSDTRHQISVKTEQFPKTIRMKYYSSQLKDIENQSFRQVQAHFPDFNGRIFGRNGKQIGNQLCYELFLEYNDELFKDTNNIVFKESEIITETTLLYAKTTVEYTEDHISSAWNYLSADWLKYSMFEQSEPPILEEYIYKGNHIKKLVLYLPIKKRESYFNIKLKHLEDMYFLVSHKTGLQAEEEASKTVIDFMTVNHPYLLQNISQFYVEKDQHSYTCGVKVDMKFHITNIQNLEIMHVTGGRYAILEGDCCGDNNVFESILTSWVEENHLLKDDIRIFTIYKTQGSFDKESIRTMTCIKLLD